MDQKLKGCLKKPTDVSETQSENIYRPKKKEVSDFNSRVADAVNIQARCDRFNPPSIQMCRAYLTLLEQNIISINKMSIKVNELRDSWNGKMTKAKSEMLDKINKHLMEMEETKKKKFKDFCGSVNHCNYHGQGLN